MRERNRAVGTFIRKGKGKVSDGAEGYNGEDKTWEDPSTIVSWCARPGRASDCTAKHVGNSTVGESDAICLVFRVLQKLQVISGSSVNASSKLRALECVEDIDLLGQEAVTGPFISHAPGREEKRTQWSTDPVRAEGEPQNEIDIRATQPLH